MNDKILRPLLILGGLYLLVKYLEGLQSQADQTTASIDTTVLGSRTMDAIQQFLATLKPIADKVEEETGAAGVIGMAEASDESAWGVSQLADPNARLTILPAGTTGPANNIFGFTAEEGTYWRKQNRPYVLMPTKEYVQDPDNPGQKKIVTVNRPFRAYSNWDESYRDWVRLMQTTHYVQAGAWDALQAGDAQAFGAALNRAGYATNPNYGTDVAARVQTVQEHLA